jgi:hypothetical protein
VIAPGAPVAEALPRLQWRGGVPYRPHTLAGRLFDSAPYRLAHAVSTMVKDELGLRTGVPLGRRLRLLRHGFLSDADGLYDFANGGMGAYLSEFARRYRCRNINALNDIFDHKVVARGLFLGLGFRQAETVALSLGGMILADPFSPSARVIGPAELEWRLGKESCGYVMKPEDAGEGLGVLLLEGGGGEVRWRRGLETGPWRASALDARFMIIERRLGQAPFWGAIHSETANSLRLLTLWTPGDPEPFVGRALQRIGTAQTIPTDNNSGGGIGVPVDLETGILGLATRRPEFRASRDEHFPRHPDSGTAIEGVALPGWREIVESVLRAARHFPYNPYVGWDVLVDQDGTPVIIEANGNTGIKIMQSYGGLLADPRVRRFYEAYGVV